MPFVSYLQKKTQNWRNPSVIRLSGLYVQNFSSYEGEHHILHPTFLKFHLQIFFF